MDHKKRDIKTAAAIIAIVKGQFLLLMFCILFCRVFELLDLIYRNYFLGRICQYTDSQNGQTIEVPSTFKVTTTNFSTQLGHLVNPLIKLL